MEDKLKKVVDSFLKDFLKPCPRCKGSGTLFDFMQNEQPCYVCRGRGYPTPEELKHFGYKEEKE